MIAHRSIGLLALALVLTTFGMTSAGAQATRGASDPMSVGKPTDIDGVYRVTQTADELAAHAPLDAGDAYQYGEGTLIFDRGWVRLIQKSDAASSWRSGTFTLRGDILRMTWRAASGVPIEYNFPSGEIDTFGWSLYRDQLALSELPGELPSAYCVKPWRRIADAPSVTFKTPLSALVGVWSNGRRVLVLRGGRFSLGKKAAEPTRANTYEALGDAIRFRTSDGVFWDYTWSIEGRVLKLKHPAGNSNIPLWNVSLIRKPWHRVRR